MAAERKNRRQTGADYERMAGRYLEKLGYKIVEYNYRCRLGEIDIIARDGEYVVFCEVKYRSDNRKGTPLEAVGVKKQQTIFRCATYYLTENHLSDAPCRFDVVGIDGVSKIKKPEITHIKNAFTG